jgi:serine/threonine protein kinase
VCARANAHARITQTPPLQVFLSKNHVNIVMDYASGGSLFDYVQARKRLKESVARWFFQQLVFAMDYCHRKARGVWVT